MALKCVAVVGAKIELTEIDFPGNKKLAQPGQEYGSLAIQQPKSVWERLIVTLAGGDKEKVQKFIPSERSRVKIQTWAMELQDYRARGMGDPRELDIRYKEIFGNEGIENGERVIATVFANALIDAVAKEDQ